MTDQLIPQIRAPAKPFDGSRRTPDLDAFNEARGIMLRAWLRLCVAGCEPEDAAEEAKATASAMRQIADLEAHA